MERNTAEYSENRELNNSECLREIFHTIESLLELKNAEEYSVKSDSQCFHVTGDRFCQGFIYEEQSIVEPRGVREVFSLSFLSLGLDQPFEERALKGFLENIQFDLNTNEVRHNIDLFLTPELGRFLNRTLEMLREEQQKEIDAWNAKLI